MAVTAGTGGTGTVDATGGTIFSASGSSAMTSIQVWCDDASAVACRVEVSGIHESAEGLHLAIGKTAVIRSGASGIASVVCKGVAGTATVHWGIVAKTGAAPM